MSTELGADPRRTTCSEAPGRPIRRRTGVCGINVWAPAETITDADPNLNRYPQTSIVLSDSGRFDDIAWGHRYQHLLALDTEPSAVAAAVLETLPPEIAAGAAATAATRSEP